MFADTLVDPRLTISEQLFTDSSPPNALYIKAIYIHVDLLGIGIIEAYITDSELFLVDVIVITSVSLVR